MREAGQRANADRTIFFIRYASHFINSINAYKFFSCAASFTHLYKNVTSAGNDLCFRMFL